MIGMGSAKLIAARSAKLIGMGSAKLIAAEALHRAVAGPFRAAKATISGSAKLIASGSAKLIASGRHSPGSDNQEEPDVSAKRIEIHILQDLVRLHRMGTGSREVARLLGVSPNTEREYRNAFAAAGLLAGDVDELPSLAELRAAVAKFAPPKVPPQQKSSVEQWSAQIEELFNKGVPPKAIFDRLRLREADFDGSLSAVKRAVRRLARARGIKPEDVAIPVETSAGQIAQVDFGFVGKLYDAECGVARKAWVFVMVLGHSRHQFARAVFDQTTETWLKLHVEAFRWFGGVTAVVVPDNLKAAVIRAGFGVDDQTALNRSYREFARYFGFKVDPTPPYAPKKKGKVESSVKYVKRNFFAGRDEQDIHEVNRDLDRWVLEVAGQRVHGTTHNRPLDVFQMEERAELMPLPAKPYTPVVWKRAKVHDDCHVILDRRLYSVPWRLTRQQVWLRATPSAVTIYSVDDERVADHSRRGSSARSTVDSHLPEHRANYRHRSRDFWEARAAKIGPETAAFVVETFESDPVLSQIRTVAAVVTHLEKFPKVRAEAACRRARRYASHSYKAIKNILAKALDLEPLPTDTAQSTWETRPMFARDLASFAVRGGRHERN